MRPLYVYRATVIRIIDGDSMVLNVDLGFDIWAKTYVRLIGIDTPELSRSEPAGHEAKEFTRLWTQEADGICLHSMKYNDREKYGRVLGDLYRTTEDGDDPLPLSVALREGGHVK